MHDNFNRRVLLRDEIRHFNPVTGRGCSGNRVPFISPGSNKVLYLLKSQLSDPNFDQSNPNLNREIYDFEYWYALSGATNKLTLAHKEIINKLAAFPLSRKFIISHDSNMGITSVCESYFHWLQFFKAPGTDAAFITSNYLKRNSSKTRLREFVNANCGALKINKRGLRQLTPNMMRVDHAQQTNFYITSSQFAVIRNSNPQYIICSNAEYFTYSRYGVDYDYLYNICTQIIPNLEHSLVILESSAANTDNYFQQLWIETIGGNSEFIALHIPWYKSQNNSLPLSSSVSNFLKSFSVSDYHLWNLGLTLEQINWARENNISDSDHSIELADVNFIPPANTYVIRSNKKNPKNIRRKTIRLMVEDCYHDSFHIDKTECRENIIPIHYLYNRGKLINKSICGKAPPGVCEQGKDVMNFPSSNRVA